MNADIQGALSQIDKSYKAFVHNGNPMTKRQVKAVLNHGLIKGYKTTAEFTDDEVENIIKKLK